jgi:hypothetical protein
MKSSTQRRLEPSKIVKKLGASPDADNEPDIPQVTAINGVINLNYIFGGVAALMYTPYVVRLFALIRFT